MRLLVLLFVPLVAFGTLAIQRIDEQTTAAHEARALVEDARLRSDVAAVYGPAQLEQIALEGLAVVDSMNVPRGLVVTFAGVDFEATYDENDRRLDDALDNLLDRHSTLAFTNGSTLRDELSFLRGTLQAQRALSSEFRADQLDVRTVFEELSSTLADAAASSELANDVDRRLSGERNQLVAMTRLMEAAGDRGSALLDSMFIPSVNAMRQVVITDARHADAAAAFAKLLDDRTAIDGLLDSLPAVSPELLALTGSADDRTSIDPAKVQLAAGEFVAHLDYLAALGDYSTDFHRDVVVTLEDTADAAERAATQTRLFVGSVIAVSLLLLGFVVWSTLRPLRRLTRRARRISDGSFDLQPLPVRGPADVRTLTSTVNKMTATLRAVDHEIGILATGPGEHHQVDLPGAIGVSLKQSFHRLESTTRQLHASELLARAIVEQAADAIWTTDTDGIITRANEVAGALTGVAPDDQIGTPLSTHLPLTDGEVTMTTPNGETVHLLIASSQIDGPTAPLVAVIARNISERLRFEERLAYQAHHDALTGLPNRYALLDAIAAAPPDEPLSVLFVDLDGFKSVNDTKGHVAGDAVLSDVAQRISRHIRPGDLVGRLGGDEFVVVSHDVADEDSMVAFAYRLIREIEQPSVGPDGLIALSASVGVATFPGGLRADGLSPLDAIRRSDSAVYAAKRHGRGRVEVFDARLQERIVRDADIELALRQAVPNGELELHLQPVFDIRSGRFAGAEALIRWNRPGVGLVPPGQFIPIAERSSLIADIGRWVLNASCDILARWQRDSELASMQVAVNVAGSHLIDGDLLADLDDAIARTGIDPRLLEFEITETQLMQDIERAKAVLAEIRSRGVSVAIDDFGTGYSSMAYLRELPIDVLKIDRSFVAGLGDGDPTVLDALLTIGHALDLTVVAEGIETAEQLAFLTAHGCDRAQGFHLARPRPAAQVERVIAPRKWRGQTQDHRSVSV